MFDNIGNKIKGVSKFFCWLGIICSILLGILLVTAGINMPNGRVTIVIGIVIMIVGSFMSWVGSLITYGIGEMVQNSCVQTEIAVRSFQKDETKPQSTHGIKKQSLEPEIEDENECSEEKFSEIERIIRKIQE